MATKTLEQVEAMKAKASRFLEDVLGDDERAEEVESESPEEYAERKRITISNPDPRGDVIVVGFDEYRSAVKCARRLAAATGRTVNVHRVLFSTDEQAFAC